jgi:hypothetical protein
MPRLSAYDRTCWPSAWAIVRLSQNAPVVTFASDYAGAQRNSRRSNEMWQIGIFSARASVCALALSSMALFPMPSSWPYATRLAVTVPGPQ